MSKISIYEVVPVPKLADKLVGTSVGGDPEDITYNFTLSELLNLFIPNIPGNTLQGVLDFGNTATQNINLTGIITTTTLNVGSTANILNSNLTGQTHITGGLYDRLNSIGTAGQVLTSTGTQVAWYTIPIVIPDLQQVLTSGNTAVNNIILTGNLSANNAALLTSTISTSLTVLGTLRDGLSSVGANNQVLSSNVTGVRWVNLPVYSATSPLLYNSGTGVFSIQQANASQNGYLSSADWITFDGKQTAISLTTTGNSGASTLVGATINVPNYTLSGLGGVPLTRTLTINGVTYNLAADRSWTLATGVSSVSATTPLFSTGGVNPDISIQQADSVLNGYLSSADWLTFNSKQPAGNYITSLTGEATGAGPGATAVTLSTTAVTGKLLTGLNLAAGGTISATDSILIAFGKTQNQISALLGGVIFKGVWNANTNTPTLVSSVGTQGWYYIVNVAGTTNLNGITDWQVGDWAIFNGTVWDKVDNTDAVSSVNGFTGAVNLTTDNIPEGATNLYYTNTRARAALSFVAGSGAYNNTTGVITIPTNNNQITNGANYITLASLSAVSPLSYINTTGVFSIQVANTSQDGYLSSIDWNTFNNKQATITLTTTGTSGAATLVGATLNIPQYQSVLTNPITGTGTTNTLPKFTAATTIGNSNITDTGSLITLGSNSYVNGSLGIGVQAPLAPLQLGNGYTESEYDGFRTTGSPSLLMAYGQTSVIHRILGGVYSQAATVNLDLSLAISKNKGTGSGFRITSGVGTGVGTSNNYLSFSSLIGASDETFTATEYMRLDANGALGIGTTSLALASLRVAKTITGGTTIYGIWQNGTVQSDVTSSAIGFLNTLNTAASAFTLSSYTHINLQQNTLGAGSSITNQYGVFIDSSLTGATNNYGFFGNIPSGTNRWNLYMNGTASNYMLGSLGIGGTNLTGYSLRVSKAMTGSSNTVGINSDGVIQSDSTSSAAYFSTFATTQAASFNLGALVHFNASRGTIGASSSITNQYGFVANDTLTGATNNYGFWGNIASGTNRWNLYMAGTAANYIAGVLSIGSTTIDSTYILDVSGQARVNNYVYYRLTGGANYYRVGILAGTANFEIYNTNIGRTDLFITQSTGSVGIGTTVTTGRNLNVSKNITGAVTSYGIVSNGTVQSDVTSSVRLFNSVANTAAASFTLSSLVHYYTEQSTIGASSVVTNQYGFYAENNLTGATNNYGFFGAIPSGTNRWNLYMNGTAANYMAGSLGIGSTSLSLFGLRVSKTITGGTIAYNQFNDGSVQSDVTSEAMYYSTNATTAASAFTLTNLFHYRCRYNIFGASSAVTNQYGFFVDSTLTAATNNYAFYSSIASGTNRWNLYMAGTAANYLAGVLNIGTTTLSGYTLDVNGTARVQGALTLNVSGQSTLFSNNYSGAGAAGLNIFIGGGGINATTGGGSAFRGSYNTSLGASSLLNITQGYLNTAIGINTLSAITTDNDNTAIGASSLNVLTGGQFNNTAVGSTSLSNLTTGSNNIAIGWKAGFTITGGSTANAISNSSIFIGSDTKALASNQTNQIVIGHNTVGLGSNTTVLGNASTTLTALYGSVITGGTSVNASAQLQVDSTTKGFLPPRMTSAQRVAIASPATGLIVYQTDGVEGLWLNTSTGWRELTVV